MIFLSLIGAGYLILFFLKVYYLGIYFIPVDIKTLSLTPHLNISIVIACKNEIQNLPSLTKSLLELNYPRDCFEIIIVNDNSNNYTTDLLTEFASVKENIKIISANTKKYPAKKGAIDIGISNARYNYILVTDADCSVEKDWILCTESAFRGGADVLFGIAPYYSVSEFPGNFFCYEQFYNSVTSFTAALYGNPYTAAARSFGFKKEVYYSIGGFDNMQNSLSGDDDLLILEALKIEKVVIPIPYSLSGRVFSHPPAEFTSYLKQKSRHTKASHFYPAKEKILLYIYHLTNSALLLSVFIVHIHFAFIVFPILKILGDVLIAGLFAKKFNYQFRFLNLLFYTFFLELIAPVHFINSVLKKDQWK